MDLHQSVKTSVANIQDELGKISTLVSLIESKPTELEQAFRKKILLEYNKKLHKVGAENTRLNEKNKGLSERVSLLESQLRRLQAQFDSRPLRARPFKSDGVLKLEPHSSMEGPQIKRRVLNKDRSRLELSSSPIKCRNDTAEKSPTKRVGSIVEADDGLTSSQFNRLATQYSDASSQPEGILKEIAIGNIQKTSLGPGGMQEKESTGTVPFSSPEKVIHVKSSYNPGEVCRGSFASDDEIDGEELDGVDRIVADSQDEFEPLENLGWSHMKVNSERQKHPSHYTALQRIEFLRNYLRQKLDDERNGFKVDFARNPITEMKWTTDDFKKNERWTPPKKINANLGVMTKAQEKTYNEFFDKAGLGHKSTGPTWDSDGEPDLGIDNGEWVRSQVMDKYSSPPGYMVGDFASTQEEEERKRFKCQKEQERIKRRLKSALTGGEFLFYEDVLNDFVRAGRYVNG